MRDARYRLPKTSSRTRIGYADESAHGRVVRGEPDGPDVVADVAQTDGAGVVDERAEESLAFRQVPDLLDGVRVHADVDELLQPTAVGADDAQRAVGGVDQLAGRLDDASQDGAQAPGLR